MQATFSAPTDHKRDALWKPPVETPAVDMGNIVDCGSQADLLKAKQQQLDDAEDRARRFQEEAEVLKKRLDEVLSKPGMGILKSSSRQGSRQCSRQGSEVDEQVAVGGSPRHYPTTVSSSQKSGGRASPIPFLRIFGGGGKDKDPPASNSKQVAFNTNANGT